MPRSWRHLGTESVLLREPGDGPVPFSPMWKGGNPLELWAAVQKAPLDVASQELVWRGTGEGEVHQASDPEERQRRADEAVWQVMSSFPPGE